jgi:hypothetical protein
MWVLYWGGKPVAWINGNSTVTIGRKDTTITITDDASISRLHCTLMVGLSAVALPAPVTFTDGSRYGTTVEFQPSDAAGSHRTVPPGDAAAAADRMPGAVKEALPQGVDWTPPASCSRIRLTLGTHGSVFDCVWESRAVAVVGVADNDTRAAAVATIQQSGAHALSGASVLDAVEAAQLVYTPVLEPLGATMAALCLAKPIVGDAYFRAITTRLTAKVPPPEPAATAALPSTIDPVWATIAGAAAGAANVIDPSIFLPRKERRALFHGQTFVCIQEVLAKELAAYVPHAGGRAVFDALPAAAVASARSSSLREALQPWALRHQAHIIAYTGLAPYSQSALDGLRALGLPAVDYHDIVRSILFVAPLAALPRVGHAAEAHALDAPTHDHLPDHQPDVLATRSDDYGGGDRMSGGGPSPGKRGREAVDGAPSIATSGASAPPVRQRTEILGAQSLYDLDASQPNRPQPRGMAGMPQPLPNASGTVAANSDDGRIVFEDLIVNEPVKLPPHPCFKEPSSTARRSATAVSGGKCFTKQALAPQVAYIAMDVVAPVAPAAAAAARGGVARVAVLDADDIVPDYNAFDAVPAHGLGPVHPGARRTGGAAQGRTARAALDAAVSGAIANRGAWDDGDTGDVELSPVPAAAPAPSKGKKVAAPRAKKATAPAPLVTATASPPRPAGFGGGGIFDLDALY